MAWVSKHFTDFELDIPSSDPESDEVYTVKYGLNRFMQDSAGHTEKYDWSCSCPDWVHRKSKEGGYCKHILHVQGLSPAQGGRSLWRSSNMDQAIPVADIDALQDLENVVNSSTATVDELLEAARTVVNTVMMYTPVTGRDGRLIQAMFIPDNPKPRITSQQNGDTQVIVIKKGERATPRQGGELPADSYALWLTYQDTLMPALREGCLDLGFNPDEYYTLLPDADDQSTPCSDCGSYMVRLHSIDPIHDGYVCPNAACTRSVNNPVNKSSLFQTASRLNMPTMPSKSKVPPVPR
jgi:SWIM zinc finger